MIMPCFITPVAPKLNWQRGSASSTFRGRRLTAPSSFPNLDNKHHFHSATARIQAEQGAPDSTPDRPFFHTDDPDTSPDPVGDDLESVLFQLGEKMSRLPVPSPDEPAKQRASNDANAHRKGVNTKRKEWNDYSEDADDEWTFEQRALYSLVKHYDDEPEDDIESIDFPSYQIDTPVGQTATKEFRKSQTDPREIDSNVQTNLRSLRERRRRIAVENGEDGFRTLRYVVTEKGEKDVDVLQRQDREVIKNRVALSLQGSRVVDFSQDIPEPSEMTAGAKRLFSEAWRIPFVYCPLFGVQEAFKRLDNPLCPRCSRSAPRSQLENGAKICNSCYSKIYLEAPFGFSTPDPFIKYDATTLDELRQVEMKQAEAAERVARSVSEGLFVMEEPNMTSGEGSEGSNKNIASTEHRTASKFADTNDATSSGKGADMNGPGVPPKRKRRKQPDQWNIQASDRSLRTINPIRNLVQNIDVEPNPKKDVIRLSVGDPTVYGNLSVSQEAIDKFCEVIRSGKANGYSMSMGGEGPREAVAKRYSSTQSPLTKEDIILTVGTSGALELALGAIANEGDNILLPRPGFPLFRTIAEGYGIECRYYEVDANKNWEIKLGDVTALADNRTRAIVVNNPSNPCGSVYSSAHIEDLLAVASALKLPIIADEVYADMVFSNQKFTAIGEASVDVPVLSVGGMSKQFVVPGWRLGWVIVHDRNKVFENGQVRKGLRQLTTRMLVPNTPAQHVLPTLLDLGMGTLMKQLEANAEFTVECLESIPGLRVIRPQGAMYVMVKIDAKKLGVEDDMDFVKQLLSEESVFVLPGQCFQAKNFVRIVFSAPKGVLSEAFSRMKEFCSRRSG